MNILHIIPYMHPHGGGPPVVVDRFSRELVSRGHAVSVITTDALAPSTEQGWVEDWQPNYDLRVFPTWNQHPYAYSSQAVKEINSSLAEFDLLHLHNLWSDFTPRVIPLAREAGVPVVVSPHGMLDPHSLSRKAWKKRLYGQYREFPALRQADAMVYTHEKERQLAEASCAGLPDGEIVPLGADEPDLTGLEQEKRRLEQRYPEWEGAQLILFLGRLHSKKGLDLLLPAMRELARTCPHARLILAGPVEADYEQQLRQEMDQLGISQRVTWTGPIFGITKWALLDKADLFALPSYQENFAITVVEALRMGLPVVLSDRVNIWEDLVQADAGVRCELNPSHIATVLDSLLRDQAHRKWMSQNGRRLVQQKYRWPVATDQLIEAYQHTMHKNLLRNSETTCLNVGAES